MRVGQVCVNGEHLRPSYMCPIDFMAVVSHANLVFSYWSARLADSPDASLLNYAMNAQHVTMSPKHRHPAGGPL